MVCDMRFSVRIESMSSEHPQQIENPLLCSSLSVKKKDSDDSIDCHLFLDRKYFSGKQLVFCVISFLTGGTCWGTDGGIKSTIYPSN